MNINQTNYKAVSVDAMIEDIKAGTFKLQTANFDAQIMDKLVQHLVVENDGLTKSLTDCVNEVKELRVELSALQKATGHPNPLPLNEKDHEAAMDATVKRETDDNAAAKEAELQAENEKKLKEQEEEKQRLLAEQVQQRIDELQKAQEEQNAKIQQQIAEEKAKLNPPVPAPVAKTATPDPAKV